MYFGSLKTNKQTKTIQKKTPSSESISQNIKWKFQQQTVGKLPLNPVCRFD